MSTSKNEALEVAQALHEWFTSIEELVEKALFSGAPEGPHRDTVVLDVLTRNARLVRTSEPDLTGSIYTPISFLLAALCEKLGVSLTEKHWHSAIRNVVSLGVQLQDCREKASTSGIELGTPASQFKQYLDEALRNSGYSGVDTILDEKNRQIALGLAVNWGLRFLIAYAWECKDNLPPVEPSKKDLAWISDLIAPLIQADAIAEIDR